MLDKLAYSTGTVSFSIKDTLFATFVLFYYAGVVGLSGSAAGLVIAISLAWDAISDPIVGSISDNLRSRWGRRHPLMMLSGIPLALTMFALFNVPEGLSQTGIFLWMLVSCLLLRTFFTVFTVPYLALGAELSTDYDQRSSIAGIRTLCGWLAGVIFAFVCWTFIFADVGEVSGRMQRENYFSLGLVSLLLVALFTTFCTLATRKHIPHLPRALGEQALFNVASMFKDMKTALRNYNFRTLFMIMLTFNVSIGVISALGTHVNTYFWELSAEQLGFQALFSILVIALMAVLMPVLNRRLEKQQILQLCILASILNALWLIPGRLLGVIPDNGTQALYGLFLLQGGIAVAILILFHTILASIIADIADEQEYETGARQEGMFFAAQGFSIKFVTGVGTLLGGLVLDLINMPSGAAPGSVEPEVLFKLGLVIGPLIACSLVVPWIISRKLRVSKSGHAEIRSLLAEKNRH